MEDNWWAIRFRVWVRARGGKRVGWGMDGPLWEVEARVDAILNQKHVLILYDRRSKLMKNKKMSFIEGNALKSGHYLQQKKFVHVGRTTTPVG